MSEISISDNNIHKMAESMTDAADSSLEEIQENAKTILLVAARQYIEILNKYQQELQNFQDVLKQQRRIRSMYSNKRDVYNQVDQYIQLTQKREAFLSSLAPREIYSAFAKFQDKLNQVLGQKVQIVYVFRDSQNNPILYKINKLQDILTYDYTKSDKMTARFSNSLKRISEAGERIDDTSDELKRKVQNLSPVYAGATDRYKQTKNKRWIMWEPSGGNIWKKIRPSAQGDINQAYASEVLSRNDFPINYVIWDDGMDVFAIAIADVDNTSGLLQGDVSVKSTGDENGKIETSIEYAIKSTDASMPNLMQSKLLAEQIIKEGGKFDYNKLKSKKEQFENAGKTRNSIYQAQVDVANKVVTEIKKWEKIS